MIVRYIILQSLLIISKSVGKYIQNSSRGSDGTADCSLDDGPRKTVNCNPIHATNDIRYKQRYPDVIAMRRIHFFLNLIRNSLYFG